MKIIMLHTLGNLHSSVNEKMVYSYVTEPSTINCSLNQIKGRTKAKKYWKMNYNKK